MAFGIDDIVESALGPWGLALGAVVPPPMAWVNGERVDDIVQPRARPAGFPRSIRQTDQS
jgi:hypothetical protein